MLLTTQQINIPKQLLTCKKCKLIFFKPITLVCGHTFCRNCLMDNSNKNQVKLIQGQNLSQQCKLNVCLICQRIIWRQISEMRENLTAKNLVQKFYLKQLMQRQNLIMPKDYIIQRQQSMVNRVNITKQQNIEQFYNKILLRIKQPSTMPMPSCYCLIDIQTFFIEDIVEQSQSIILTWDDLSLKNLGLLCKLIKAQPLQEQSETQKIISSYYYTNYTQQKKYQMMFLGLNYVKIQNTYQILLNPNKNYNTLQKINQKYLQICNCKIIHSITSQPISMEQFKIFFQIYDSSNSQRYNQMIRAYIVDQPFQKRDNQQLMLYCILRLLKIPNKDRKQLVLCFDNYERIQKINAWLLQFKNRLNQDTFHIKVPRKYNAIVLFLMFFISLIFHFFDDPKNGQKLIV